MFFESMGSGNSRDLTVDKESYFERVPSNENKFQENSKESNSDSSTDSAFNQSFEPNKTDFVKNIAFSPGEFLSKAEVNELKEIYEQKIQELHDKNAKLHGATVSHLAETVQMMEKKFLKASNKTICEDSQSAMVACLKKNKGESLRCSHNVDAFNTCMQQYRKSDGLHLIHHQLNNNNNNKAR